MSLRNRRSKFSAAGRLEQQKCRAFEPSARVMTLPKRMTLILWRVVMGRSLRVRLFRKRGSGQNIVLEPMVGLTSLPLHTLNSVGIFEGLRLLRIALGAALVKRYSG